MNILNRLAKKNLKLNKKRTIVTIIGIILAVALITGVSTVATSFQTSRIEHQRETEGDYHYELIGVPNNKIEEIAKNENVERIFVTKEMGTASYLNENKSANLEISELSKEAFNNLGIKLLDGRLPENSEEVVISDNLEKYSEINLEIGSDINLGFSDTNNNKQEENYKIVGKVEITSKSIENSGANNYTYAVLSCLENYDDNSNYNVYIKFKDLNKRLDTIGTILGLNIDSYKSINNIVKAENKLLDNQSKLYDLNINNGLIQLEGGGYIDATEEMIYYISFIIILVIIIISVYCIKNSFYISMTERIRDYGMLASIGATKKQIKKEMQHEAYLIGLIAIPIGLLIGIFGIYIILKMIQDFFSEELFGMTFIFSVNFVSIITAILLSIVTIYLSVIGTARKVSKVEPIEAIRENKDIQINRKNIKSSRIIKRLFGIGGDIAYKNLKRNKRKYRTTVVSITLSIIAFITVMSFVNYTNKINEILLGNISYDVQVYGDYKGLSKIAKDSEITKYSLLAIKDANLLNYDGHVTDESKLKGTDYPAPEIISIVSLGEQEYARYIQKLELNYDDVKDKAILYDFKTRTIEEGQKDRYLLYRVYNFEEGDYIEYSINSDNEDIKSYEIEIAKIANQKPMYLVNSDTSYLIVSNEYWNDVKESTFGVDVLSIVTDNAEEMMEYIQNKFDGDYDSIVNIDKSEKERKAQIITITVFLSLFIGVTTLIGITNIFNTITTSMELRLKEFANLKAIGMTKKEFNRMIRLETIFYCIKSLIIGIPLGLILSYTLYKAFEINFIGLKFVWPLSAILISIIAVFILIGVIMKYSLNKINKQNIIETLRKENI